MHSMKIHDILRDLHLDVVSFEDPGVAVGVDNDTRRHRNYRNPDYFKTYLPRITREKEYLQLRLMLYRIYELHTFLPSNSYRLDIRLELAQFYEALGYPDLAVGEAYRVLLLVDEILDDSGEYHEQAREAIQSEIQYIPPGDRLGFIRTNADPGASILMRFLAIDETNPEVEDDEIELWAREHYSIAAYTTLARCLASCGSLKSAFEFCQRGLKFSPQNAELNGLQKSIATQVQDYYHERRGKMVDLASLKVENYPERGQVRRELYPWNLHEPDRFSAESLRVLNQNLALHAPHLEVRVTTLPVLTTEVAEAKAVSQTNATIKQLGVFAKKDLDPNEVILNETSLLTSSSRLHDPFCDACSAPIPISASQSLSPISCEECGDVIFCGEKCYDLAKTSYHPAVCGTDAEAIAKDAPAADAADALYSLLLLRALAMAHWQEVHPLDLIEVKYIWGDYHPVPIDCPGAPLFSGPTPTASEKEHPVDAFCNRPRTLPFSFDHNILMPLHMLEKMDINIFETSLRYDFWVINTLYAKFRGTASAKQGPDGRPEVGAVHPFWCLANHSCDPNVAWDWQGSIKFWVRETRVKYGDREAAGQGSDRPKGIKKDEEIMSHYCDVDLPVKERREWATGALGGMCMCERCVWEAGFENENAEKP